MIRVYLVALVSSFLFSLAATPASVWLARKWGVLDPLDPRKVHTTEKPRWGGIGIVSGFFFALLVVALFQPEFKKVLNFSHGVVHNGKLIFTLNLGEQLAGILFGTVLLFFVGLYDDKKPIPAGMKLLFQIIAAYVAMTYGVKIYGLSIPGFESYAFFPLWLMQIVTILWLVGLCNAVNLIDGLDGLAGGTVAIVAGAFLAVTLIQEGMNSVLFDFQMRLAGLIAAALMGGVLGFLIYNFYPSQVFMGDGGSLSVGFLIACIAAIGAFKTTILAILIVPFLLVAIPVTDMAFAFGRRILNKQSPFKPDRGHLHHRLLDSGWTQKEVVLLVYTVTLVLSLVSVTMTAIKK